MPGDYVGVSLSLYSKAVAYVRSIGQADQQGGIDGGVVGGANGRGPDYQGFLWCVTD